MYDEYYGLTGRPFQLTPDPAFYFESGTHRKALSYLGYGLAQGEGFIIITGDVGAGKSTLVSHLMQSIDRARMSAATIVTSQLDAHDLVKMAAESFGIDTRGLDKAASLRSIENFLHAEARTGRRCLLVVDEAQNLSIEAVEELRMLSNFQLGSTSLLQIFLLGQPEFRDLVRDAPELEQLRQRVIATHHLDPMDESEVEHYVKHRLSRAGWQGNPGFAPDVFPMLFTETGGVPRKLNTLMNRVMLMGAVELLSFIDSSTVSAVVADMTGQPFAYDAQLSEEAPVVVADRRHADILNEVRPEDFIIDDSVPDDHMLVLPTHNDVIPEQVPQAQESTQVNVEAATLADLHPQDSQNREIDILRARLDLLEKRVLQQDDDLRRVLATMIEWMNKEGSVEARFQQDNRAA
ncbi:MAG: XrtA/PEP-CTERM system-associated ATPase [Pseudomonadota bacterium]